MPAALTSDVALEYVRELSTDITGAILLDAGGHLLAGTQRLHLPARALLQTAPAGPAELQGRTATGAVFAARDDAHQLVVTTGRFALPRLTRHDLRTTLAALSGGRAMPETTPIEAQSHLVEALLEAAEGRF
jgi:hypothetical protein